MNSLIP